MLELAIAVARWLAEPKLKSRLTGLGGPPSPRLRIFDATARLRRDSLRMDTERRLVDQTGIEPVTS